MGRGACAAGAYPESSLWLADPSGSWRGISCGKVAREGPEITSDYGRSLYMNRTDGETDRRRRFGALCESLRPDLLRFAWWLGRDRALAEDVVQEAMLRAWKSFDALTDEGKAKAWLLTIVRREFARTFERKRLELSDVDALVASESAVLASPGDERVAEMREAIFRLDPEYREPLVLQVLMGYSTREIAEKLGVTEGTVKAYLHGLFEKAGVTNRTELAMRAAELLGG